jgi:hypothetical protein
MSVLRTTANTERAVQGYINIVALGSTTTADTFDATGAIITGGAITDSAAAGAVLVRDMGKTVRVPQLGNVVNTSGTTKYRVLRKVQLVHAASMDVASTNNGNSNTDGVINTAGSSNKLLAGGTFYIELGGNTVGGGVMVGLGGSKWARVAIPN